MPAKWSASTGRYGISATYFPSSTTCTPNSDLYASFERGVNEEIGERLGVYAGQMERINGQVRDLRDIFSKQHYVHPEFRSVRFFRAGSKRRDRGAPGRLCRPNGAHQRAGTGSPRHIFQAALRAPRIPICTLLSSGE